MTNYERGRRLEWDTVKDLDDNGYATIRAASSKGIADVVGFKPGQVLFIQAKTNGIISPADRVNLLWLAAMIPGGIAIVVSRPRVTYRRLTGPGPKQWEPWTMDEVIA